MAKPCLNAESPSASRLEFEETALPHLDALYNMALKMARNPSLAEDLVQEAFVRAYRFFSHYERGTNCKAWLFKILRNVFINHYRKVRGAPETVDFAAIEGYAESHLGSDGRPGVSSPEEIVADMRMGEGMTRALGSLTPEFRMVALLAFVEGYSYKEIASIMSCPIGTVMSRLSRARKVLQEALLPHAQERGLIERARTPAGVFPAPHASAAYSSR
jgi:RNA polymerase sigma-70 factor, ECF subfamily